MTVKQKSRRSDNATSDSRAKSAAGAGSARLLLRSFLLNCVLFCSSMLVAVLLGEVLVRVVAPQQLVMIRPDMYQAADTIGWLARPGVHTTVNTGEGTVDFNTDQDGFRVSDAGRVNAAKEILLIGDS